MFVVNFKLNFSGGFGESRILIQLIKKESLYWNGTIACLTAIVSTIFANMSKSKVYITINLTVMIILNVANLYTLSFLKTYPIGNIAFIIRNCIS
ncbi:hypothetical protein QFZ81_001532 [Paenibacillus sp. V4I9]|nr:hypothetical protein [Paenibacillus sp. V4I9]